MCSHRRRGIGADEPVGVGAALPLPPAARLRGEGVTGCGFVGTRGTALPPCSRATGRERKLPADDGTFTDARLVAPRPAPP